MGVSVRSVSASVSVSTSRFTKCCACYEICTSRSTKCCACHEICTWLTMRCACHEICTSRFTKCCACHKICTSRFSKCWTCHEICTSRFTKCCACYEICTSRSTKCCACHEICTSRFTKCCTCYSYEICTSRFSKCCACHEICTSRFTKCCTCHELCTSRFTKCCTCHEICASRVTECCSCHQICNKPRVQKSQFTAPVTKSELLDDHHHAQSAAPATKTAFRSKTPPIPCTCRFPLRLAREVTTMYQNAHGTTTRAQSPEAPAAGRQILRACAVEVHMDDVKNHECTVNSSELAAHARFSDLSISFLSPTVRTPQCAHTVWGKNNRCLFG